MAAESADSKLKQWNPKILLKLLGEKKYEFTTETTREEDTIRLLVYTPDRLKDQPKFEQELTKLSKVAKNNLSWQPSKDKSSKTITPTEVTIEDKKYILVYKPLDSTPGKTSTVDASGKVKSIKLKPSEIKSFTSISLKTAVPDDAIRKTYFKENENKD